MAMEIFVDCLGEICPVPALRAKAALKRATPGDVIVIETDHSCTMKNLPDLLRKMGYQPAVEEVAVGVWQIRVPVSADVSRTPS